MYRQAFLPVLILALLFPAAAGAISFDEAIRNPDPTGKYLFYLHGAIMEKQGKNATSKRYGVYMYDRIIKHFEDRDLIVIDEVRGKTNPHKYSSKIVEQIHRLMAAGIPPGNITVSGFSKGGHIALLIASSLRQPDVGFVIMAGCGKGITARSFNQFLKAKRGARLKGRIYSIYASSDLEAGSCRDAIAQSSGEGLQFRENRVKTGKGHGLFYQPRPEWIDPTAIFARGGR